MKKILSTSGIVFIFFWLLSCNNNNRQTQTKDLTPEEIIHNNIDTIRMNCKPGDLITRLNDDMLSEFIKELAENDKSYSHAGIIVKKGNETLVCHIFPNEPGADTVLYEPLDSFINPLKNLSCGLFRYNISDSEKQIFLHQLDTYHANNIHFDNVYDIKTDSALYCSEMIAKALKIATNNQIICEPIAIPKPMVPLMKAFFKKYKTTKDQVENTPFIPIENLYNKAYCTEIMRTKLKYMP